MAYQKLKREQYKNAGGINQKASVYVTGENQVLDLVNYDLQTTGAWSQRPGMTNGMTNIGAIAVGASNRFNFGFQTFRVLYDTTLGSTVTSIQYAETGYIQGNSYTYVIDPHGGGFGYAVNSTFATTPGNGNAVNALAPCLLTFGAIAATNVLYLNNAYASVGGRTYKAMPQGMFTYGLPPYGDGPFVATPTIGTSGTGSLSGSYYFRLCYLDCNGYVGTPGITMVQSVGSGYSNIILSNVTFTSLALASGATSIFCYANRVTGFGTNEFVLVSVSELGTSTMTLTGVAGGLLNRYTPSVPGSVYDKYLTLEDKVPNFPEPSNRYEFNTGYANAVEYYSDRIFWGSSGGKNIIFYSDPIETQDDAQFVRPDAFITARNQDYPLIALKAYNQSLMVFFQEGVSRLTGTDETNFNLQDLTNEYGAVSSRAILVWKSRLWFLDDNSIMDFDGTTFTNVSEPVQDYLNRLNVSAAQNTATAYHYVARNELWFAIPIDSSNENNVILVFDYDAGGWYTIKSVSNFTMLQEFSDYTFVRGISNPLVGVVNRNPSSQAGVVYVNDPRLYTGHPGGSLGYFGASFTTDYGNPFTLTFKTRYHSEQGPSTTMMWRRFYLDTGPWAGVTLPFATNFYSNFATSTISLTRTIYASGQLYSGQQQTRIDFGIAAKSLSVESSIATSLSRPPVRIYGYTVESRFLRSV